MDDRDEDVLPEMTPEQEREALLRTRYDLSPLMVSALDRVEEDAWSVLWVQHELSRLADDGGAVDPEELRRAICALPDAEVDCRRRLSYRVERIDVHLEYLETLGFRFDFDKLLVVVVGASNRPPALYRLLVEALDRILDEVQPKLKRREKLDRMAEVLEPFFIQERTATSSPKSLLARTYDNV